jgi:hypothetical protein
MSYKLRCTEDTYGYLLWYGKGGRKLATLARRDGNAFTTEQPRFTGMLREVKEKWGAWAAAEYAGGRVTQSSPVDAPEIAGSNPALPIIQERPDSVFVVRQGEIDHAATQAESDDWYRHVTVLEQKHAERDPSYVMHIYRRRGGPPVRQVKQ